MAKYKITVVKIETVTQIDKEWQRLYDSEAFKELQYKKGEDIKQYGYETIEKVVDEEKEVFKQIVEDNINLVAIINAVNGIEK